MKKNLEKNDDEKSNSINDGQDDLTVEKLRELLKNPTMGEEEAKEIIFGINTLVSIIINFQQEQELQDNNIEEFNLNQAA